MKLAGSRQLNAPQDVVWAKLNDTAVLRRCIPGCETLERVSDTELKATTALKIGPMNVKFTGDVALSDLQPPHSYRISGTGKGGPAGMASGGADVRLEAKDGGTLLTYEVDANVSGKIAQLGQRLIDATAAQLAEKFFTSFAAEVEAPAVEAAVTPTVTPAAATAPAAQAAAIAPSAAVSSTSGHGHAAPPHAANGSSGPTPHVSAQGPVAAPRAAPAAAAAAHGAVTGVPDSVTVPAGGRGWLWPVTGALAAAAAYFLWRKYFS